MLDGALILNTLNSKINAMLEKTAIKMVGKLYDDKNSLIKT
jgi:hypothetical protein